MGRHSVPEGQDSTYESTAAEADRRRRLHQAEHGASGTAADHGKIGQRRDPSTAADPE